MEQHQSGGAVPPTELNEGPSYEEEYAAEVAGGGFPTGKRSINFNQLPRNEGKELVKIRSEMEDAFRAASDSGPLWEEVARKLAELGYKRSARRWKEKFEKYKKTKGMKPSSSVASPSMRRDDGSSEKDGMITAEVGISPIHARKHSQRSISSVNKRKHGSTGSNELKALFEGFMKQVVERQEEMQRRFLEALEKREEAWRRQEMDRLNCEREQIAQERAAFIAFLQRSGQTPSDVVPTTQPVPWQRQPPVPWQGQPVPPVPFQLRPKHDEPRTARNLDLTETLTDDPSELSLESMVSTVQQINEPRPSQYQFLDKSGRQDERVLETDHTELGVRHMLEATLSYMYEHIELAECWVHKDSFASLLQEAKDAVYSAEDLLDEFHYYQLQDEIEHDANNRSVRPQFFSGIGITMKLVHGKLNHLIAQMKHLGLHDVQRQQFIFESRTNDDLASDETIIGRQEELQVLIDLLVSHNNNPIGRQVTGAAEVPHGDQAMPENLSVFAISGDGTGKTALARCIFNQDRVRNHFDHLVWICVSDGFNDKKLIKRLAWSVAESEMKSDDLSCLQRVLTNGIIHCSRRLLLVLDDLREDVCQEYYSGWESFLAPLKCARLGSIVLVTTRSTKVAEHISKRPLQLESLPEKTFWHLFSMHAFHFIPIYDSNLEVMCIGLLISGSNQEVEHIGRRIVSRLNGSPLGAKILGCLLNLKLDAEYWTSILENELWELGHQKETRIWPALQLSYQYLPFHLKRCFSFCSLYPRGHEFDVETLVDSWIAAGLVVPSGSTPAVDVGREYFSELVSRSFFQKSPTSASSSYAYVMQGLLYEMAQQISMNECFVIKDYSDWLTIPSKVRHVSILSYGGLSSSDLKKLNKNRALRSVVCIGIDSDAITTSVIETWFYDLTNIRMLRFISCRLTELPGNVGNLICLRYLDISSCNFETLPDSFWRLHKLQILDARNCGFHEVPKDIIKLVNLQKVRLKGDLINQLGCVQGVGKLISLQEMPYFVVDDTPGRGIQELKNLNFLRGALEISGLYNVKSKEQAAGADLDKKIHLDTLVLSWHDSIRPEPDKHNPDQEMEVLEGLHPSRSIKHLEVRFYMGSGFHPSWLLHGKEDDSTSSRLESLSINSCPNITNLFVPETGSRSSSSSLAVFRSLTKLCVTCCTRLSSLGNLLQPELLPVIRVIQISKCEELASLPTNLGEFSNLEDLELSHCWSLSWEGAVALPSSLRSLKLEACGELTDSALWGCLRELTALATLDLQFCPGVVSIGAEIWSSLPSLRSLKIFCCQELSSIGGAESIAPVEKVDIRHCPKLRELEQPFLRGC